MKISIIVAAARNGVIGKDGKIPWHIPEDMKHFKETTSGHIVIMGRKTHESIGKPLPNRAKVYLTTIDRSVEGDTFFETLSSGEWWLSSLRTSAVHSDVTFEVWERRSKLP